MFRQPLLLTAVVVLAAALGASIVWREVASDSVANTAQEFARPLAALCQVDEQQARALGTDCTRVVVIARDGVDGGEDGRGIIGTSLNAAGHLVVAYSDGTTVDVGRVTGTEGPGGPAGRGIDGFDLASGRLVIQFDDGTSVDLGPIIGPEGRGIANLDGSSGRLLVTLTDGDVIDAGPLPEGPRGEPGTPAPSVQSETRTYSDGSSERCVRSGGPDSDPEFGCEVTPPPPADPPPTGEGTG
jgi:hypothetical protein